MRKEFPTKSVLGVVTGYALEDGAMAGVHEVMDHLYPGIMTIGVAAMQSNASRAILSQLPHVSDWLDANPLVVTAIKEWCDAATTALGDTLQVEGPLTLQPGEAEAAFRWFLGRGDD